MKMLQIENKNGRVKLNDAVSPWSVDELIEEMGKLYGKAAVGNSAMFGIENAVDEDAVDSLEIELNSPGGSVLDGYRLYHEIRALRARGVHVTATINSLAASMASVIAMAADVVQMVPGGLMMIHEASQYVGGDSATHLRAAKLLDEMSGDIAGIYAKRTGGTPEEMRALMKEETWMGTKEALERGFIDRIMDPAEAKKLVDIGKQNSNSLTMSLLDRFKPDAELTDKFNAALADNESLVAQLSDLQTKLAEAQGLAVIVSEKEAEITNLQTEREGLTNQINSFTAQVSALTAELETEKSKTTPEAIQALALAALAEAGQPAPLAGSEEEEPKGHLETFQSLKGTAATDYFKKHKAEIMAEINKQK